MKSKTETFVLLRTYELKNKSGLYTEFFAGASGLLGHSLTGELKDVRSTENLINALKFDELSAKNVRDALNNRLPERFYWRIEPLMDSIDKK